ncbi:MAG: thymidine kinase [Clostridia bacterium]
MGYINVYTGPMKCGKSQRIFNELKRQLIAGKNVKVFKPLLDDRSGDDVISTRAGNSIKAINIQNISEIENYEADSYFIDEFQFLQGDVHIIDKMASSGKKFYIAGLNLTSEKKVFGKMGDLMCIADNIEMMTSICEVCKSEEAVFTYFKGKKDTDIMVGDSEYLPVCRNCYNQLISSSFSKTQNKIAESKELKSNPIPFGKILVNDFNYQCHF